MPARSSLAGNALAVPGFPPISISHPGPGGTSSGTTQYLYYEGNTLKVTDPAGKWKKYETDVFGNLIKVIEPRPGGGADLETLYAYDIYNRLRTVTMTRSSGSQTRTFTYDGTTQRLLSVTNPENGTTYFTYTGYGTVATRRDAKQNRFEYSYDGKLRVTQVRRYPLAGPSGGTEDLCQRVDYSYDTNPYDGAYTQYGLGRPTAARWGGAGCAGAYTWTEMYSYTQAGRVTKKKLTPGSTFGTTGLESVQTYDNEGRMVTVKYPNTNNSSGGVVTGPTYGYSFDAIARPSGLTENVTQPMVQSVVYNAASQITSMQYLQYTGGPTWLTETRQYNVRLQMTSQTVAPSGGGAALMDLRYNYSATQNNGRIGSMQDLVSGETVTYQYDELQRLISASAAGWGNSYTFDGFGNLLAKNVTGGLAPSLSINVDGNTNRITTGGYGYDLNGNLTTLPGVTGIGYDADNRLVTASGEQYNYAPSNQRVWLRKSGGAVEHFTFYGVDGVRLGVYSKGTYNLPLTGTYFAVVKQEVYFAGKRIRSGGLAVAEDRLGSTRREDTTASRYYPYGEEFTPTTAEDRQKFGTYYRDAGTQLDYANQRYYSATIGRFLTADPGPFDPATPQSWDRYSYAWNDSANLNDPDGMLPANVASDTGCMPGPFLPPGGAVDASSNCPPGQFWVGFGGHGGSKSRLQQIRDAFDPLSRFIEDWEYANASGTRFDITLSLDLFEDSFLPQLAGAGAGGGIILIGGGPITWTVTVTGAVILTGVALWQTGVLENIFFSKGGKQNVAHPWIWELAKIRNPIDPCKALKEMMDEARNSGESRTFNAAKATHKAFCR